MKMKKIVSVLLAITCLASVAACGGNSDGYAKVGAPDYSQAQGELLFDS